MIQLRPARPDDLPVLSDLALRSKGHWGYDPDFLEACREELTITPARLASESIWVAEWEGQVVGFSAATRGPVAELMDLFVEPERIGTGVGRALWEHAVEEARRQGASRLRIEADPNAEGWYLRRGAVRVGEAPSASIVGRTLPLLELQLA